MFTYTYIYVCICKHMYYICNSTLPTTVVAIHCNILRVNLEFKDIYIYIYFKNHQLLCTIEIQTAK